jgi:hypothetical protein
MDLDVGTARVVYETPDGIERTEVDNEHVAFVDEHWVIVRPNIDGDDGTVTRIPRDRVYAVERSTDEVESKAASLLDEATSKLG